MSDGHLEKVREIIEERGIGWVALGAVAGLEPDRMHDVVTYDRELWHISLAAFLRLCLVLDLPPAELLPGDAYTAGKRYTATEPAAGSAGLAYELRDLISDRDEAATAVGCEPEALDSWLSDDYHLSQIPLFALDALCEHLTISLAEALKTFWHDLGRAEA